MHFNNSSNKEILRSHEHCSIQPYLSGNYQMDLLLRNHNWGGGINTPITLSYKITIDSNPADTYKESYWSNEGKQLALSIKYLHDLLDLLYINNKLITYIEDNQNRDANQLYENNFESSFTQNEYMLSTQFENIKYAIENHNKHEAIKDLTWISSVESIYNLDLNKLSRFITTSKKEATNITTIEYVITLDDNNAQYITVQKDLYEPKFYQMAQYVFNFISEVANVNFKEVTKGEQINILAKPTSPHHVDHTKSEYFSIEDFHYSNGITHHVTLNGDYQVNNDSALTNMNFAGTLHGIGHVFIDHPNDANIAIRKNLIPLDNDDIPAPKDWRMRNEDHNIAHEYRSDNACMSVMAFTKCFYQEKNLEAFTYMPIDIQALQYLYGKNEQTRSADTTYILTAEQIFINDMDHPLFPMDIPTDSIYSLYDAGGENTLDLSLVEQATIDLNEGAGHFNAIGNNIFLIAYGTHIHNVIIGSGDIELKLHSDLNNSVTVPNNGAKVTIENLSSNDTIILDGISNQDLEFMGCIHPYENISDSSTEVCFV